MIPSLLVFGCGLPVAIVRWGTARLPQRLLPWAAALPFFPVYTLFMREGRVGGATAATFAWACAVFLGALWNGLDRGRPAPPRGELVAAGLATWVRTGLPAWGSSRARWRRTGIRVVVTALSAVVSGGYLTLPLAATLLAADGHGCGRLGAGTSASRWSTALACAGPWGPLAWLGHALLLVCFGMALVGPDPPSTALGLLGASICFSTVGVVERFGPGWARDLRNRVGETAG